MIESVSELVMPFIYRILFDKDSRIVLAALFKQFIEPGVVPSEISHNLPDFKNNTSTSPTVFLLRSSLTFVFINIKDHLMHYLVILHLQFYKNNYKEIYNEIKYV